MQSRTTPNHIVGRPAKTGKASSGMREGRTTGMAAGMRRAGTGMGGSMGTGADMRGVNAGFANGMGMGGGGMGGGGMGMGMGGGGMGMSRGMGMSQRGYGGQGNPPSSIVSSARETHYKYGAGGQGRYTTDYVSVGPTAGIAPSPTGRAAQGAGARGRASGGVTTNHIAPGTSTGRPMWTPHQQQGGDGGRAAVPAKQKQVKIYTMVDDDGQRMGREFTATGPDLAAKSAIREGHNYVRLYNSAKDRTYRYQGRLVPAPPTDFNRQKGIRNQVELKSLGWTKGRY